MKHVLVFALTCAALVGCSHAVSPNLVKTKASSDLSCAELSVSQVTRNNWKAEGCGKSASYICSDANFMSDGVCMRE